MVVKDIVIFMQLFFSHPQRRGWTNP